MLVSSGNITVGKIEGLLCMILYYIKLFTFVRWPLRTVACRENAWETRDELCIRQKRREANGTGRSRSGIQEKGHTVSGNANFTVGFRPQPVCNMWESPFINLSFKLRTHKRPDESPVSQPWLVREERTDDAPKWLPFSSPANGHTHLTAAAAVALVPSATGETTRYSVVHTASALPRTYPIRNWEHFGANRIWKSFDRDYLTNAPRWRRIRHRFSKWGGQGRCDIAFSQYFLILQIFYCELGTFLSNSYIYILIRWGSAAGSLLSLRTSENFRKKH